ATGVTGTPVVLPATVATGARAGMLWPIQGGEAGPVEPAVSVGTAATVQTASGGPAVTAGWAAMPAAATPQMVQSGAAAVTAVTAVRAGRAPPVATAVTVDPPAKAGQGVPQLRTNDAGDGGDGGASSTSTGGAPGGVGGDGDDGDPPTGQTGGGGTGGGDARRVLSEQAGGWAAAAPGGQSGRRWACH
ncbi:hypothetical protein OSJ04_24655, partial [Mycobacterium ulcerans]